MILLDTNAILWLLAGHARARPLEERGARLYVSPVSLLELQLLVEIGRLAERSEGSVRAVAEDPRWAVDSPSSDALFEAALDLEWTREPFDRLLVAHARYRRWRFATGDRHLQGRIEPRRLVAL